MKRRRTDYIVVHGTYTPAQMDVTPEDVDRWHRERGFRCNGYHLHLHRDGTPRLTPRKWDEMGAGVLGYNPVSFHVVLVGGAPADAAAVRRGEWEFNYTEAQLGVLRAVLPSLFLLYPDAKLVGHNDLDTRGCPGFNVREWWANGRSESDN
jgi:N-acetylmuramoyl-L-alanine amidase